MAKAVQVSSPAEVIVKSFHVVTLNSIKQKSNQGCHRKLIKQFHLETFADKNTEFKKKGL